MAGTLHERPAGSTAVTLKHANSSIVAVCLELKEKLGTGTFCKPGQNVGFMHRDPNGLGFVDIEASLSAYSPLNRFVICWRSHVDCASWGGEHVDRPLNKR